LTESEKILVIRFSSIGDIVQCTSVLAEIRKQHPNSRIFFMTLDRFAQLLEGQLDIDEILIIDKKAGYAKLRKLSQYLNLQNFKVIFDLHNSLRSKIILRQLKNVTINRIKKPRWKRFKLFQFHLNDFDNDFSYRQMLIESLGEYEVEQNNIPKSKLNVNDTEIKNASTLLGKIGVKRPFVAIIPGAAWHQKQWVVSEYNKLFEKISSTNKIDFILLGSGKDYICKAIVDHNSKIHNLQNSTTIRETLAVISLAKFVIGSDTGFLHAAEALGKNVVLILGPTTNETGAGIQLSNSIVIENDEVWCRPCSQNGKRPCYRSEQFCRTTINADSIYSKIKHAQLI